MGSFSLTKEHRPCLCVLELSVKQRMHKEQSSYSDEMICHDLNKRITVQNIQFPYHLTLT